MKRVFLFLATNLAIIVVLSITLRLLGVERILDEQGVDLNLNALLIFAGVFGFGGSFISLALSKWTAKRMTGAQVISQPRSQAEPTDLRPRAPLALALQPPGPVPGAAGHAAFPLPPPRRGIYRFVGLLGTPPHPVAAVVGTC